MSLQSKSSIVQSQYKLAGGTQTQDQKNTVNSLDSLVGMLNTAAVWAPVAKRLSSHAEVRIANVQTQASIAEMARDAWALVADVPINTPLVVCGFSMGGYVTIEMLAACVRPVGAIGLLDTSARPETPEGALIREKTISAIERNFARMVDNVRCWAPALKRRPSPC